MENKLTEFIYLNQVSFIEIITSRDKLLVRQCLKTQNSPCPKRCGVELTQNLPHLENRCCLDWEAKSRCAYMCICLHVCLHMYASKWWVWHNWVYTGSCWFMPELTGSESVTKYLALWPVNINCRLRLAEFSNYESNPSNLKALDVCVYLAYSL